MKKLILYTLLIIPALSFSQFRGVDWGSSKAVAKQNETNKGAKYEVLTDIDDKSWQFVESYTYLNSIKVRVHYTFLNDKLVRGSYWVDDNYYNMLWNKDIPQSYSRWQKLEMKLILYENYLNIYEKIRKQLTKKYGPAKTSDVVNKTYGSAWDPQPTLEDIDVEIEEALNSYIDQSKIYGKPQMSISPNQKLAYKIANHKIDLRSEWETKTTNVHCEISSGGFSDFMIYITYSSKHYKEAIRKHVSKKEKDERLNGVDDY